MLKADYSTYTDQELILLLRQWDELAFTEVYRRYWHMLALHAWRMLNDKTAGQDLVQDLFFSFWTKVPELDIQTNLKGYLYRSLRNRVLNHVRKQKSDSNLIDLMATEIDEQDHTTTDLIDERQFLELIERELEKLNPRSREIFNLSRKEFLSNKEIAERMGMSEEAVKKQIQRTVKILKLRTRDIGGLSVLLVTLLEQRQHW